VLLIPIELAEETYELPQLTRRKSAGARGGPGAGMRERLARA
jgi:hypothetical protein